MHDDHDGLQLLGRGWSENHVYTYPDVRCLFDLSVCGPIWTGRAAAAPPQCRWILHCRCWAFLDQILSFPKTRSAKTNLTRKRPMPSYWRCVYRMSRSNLWLEKKSLAARGQERLLPVRSYLAGARRKTATLVTGFESTVEWMPRQPIR